MEVVRAGRGRLGGAEGAEVVEEQLGVGTETATRFLAYDGRELLADVTVTDLGDRRGYWASRIETCGTD